MDAFITAEKEIPRINKYTLLLLSALQATNVFASASSSYPTVGASSKNDKYTLVTTNTMTKKRLTIEVSLSMTGQQFEELASQGFGQEGRILSEGQLIDLSKPIYLEEFRKAETIYFLPFNLPTSESVTQHAQSNPEYASLLSVMDAIKDRDWSTAHRRFNRLDEGIKGDEKFGKPIAALLARRK